MGQNLADVHFDATQWTTLDGTIASVEQTWQPMLVTLEGDPRRLIKMGRGSEVFCHAAYRVMNENRHLMPPDIDVDEMGRDLASHDELATRRTRIDRLVQKLTDTDIALGSDIMATALRGYAQLKLSGKAAGLDSLRRELGKQFEKSPRKKRDEVSEAA